MKKFILIALSAAMLLSLASCGNKKTDVVHIDSTEPQTTPTQSAAKPITEPSNALPDSSDPTNTPKATEGTDNSDTQKATEGTENKENSENQSDGKLENITGDDASKNPKITGKTEPVKGITLNEVFSETGDEIDTAKKDDKTVYTVKYSRALSLVVEVSQRNDNGKITVLVDAYLNHYSMYMGEGKKITVNIGNYSKTETLPVIDHKDESAARTKLISAEYTAAKGEIVDIKVNMPYEGNYGDKYIKSLSFSGSVATN